jgi:hypothetical protein
MRHYVLLLLIGFTLSLTSCRNDFEFERSTGGLEFSKDTVYLDTVFTNIGSSTYTLKVYNHSNKDIKIPSLRLGQGDASKYRLMVDGIPGRVFNDIELLAKDSMFVFIETTIDYSEYENDESSYLYTDRIEFDAGSNLQTVELVTLVQDAVFIKPDRTLPDNIKELLTVNGQTSDIEGHELATPEELHWTNEKPYVVYGYALVPNGQELVIDAGARIHYHSESGLIIDKTAKLTINGALSTTEDLENEVVFEGDRLEPDFADVPGQWGSLLILSGQDNKIEHLTLRNAGVGIFLRHIEDTTVPKLEINNSQIYNCAFFGILARHVTITGTNLVVNNTGQAGIALTQGGNYDFRNCTFANYFNSFQQVPVAVNDYFEDTDLNTVFVSDLTANFHNCIIYGSGNYGLSMERVSEELFDCNFNHCLIKLVDFGNQLDDEPLYPYDGNNPALVSYTGCLLAESSTKNKPDFFDPTNNKLTIGVDSAAINLADTAFLVPLDILGFTRADKPDAGAYVNQPFPDGED